MEELANRVLDREPEAVAEAQEIRADMGKSPEAEQKWEDFTIALIKRDWPLRGFLAERGIKGDLSKSIGSHVRECYVARSVVDGALMGFKKAADKLEEEAKFIRGLAFALEGVETE